MFSSTYKRQLILFFMLFSFSVYNVNAQTNNFNKSLADSLGADDYGMKMYVLVMLKTGPATVTEKAKRDSIFGGHLQNIKRLADEGKLVVAGPMQENDKNYEGIFILNVKTTAQAKALLDTDPAIRAQLLATELYGWYGSAALPLYLPQSKKIAKKSF